MSETSSAPRLDIEGALIARRKFCHGNWAELSRATGISSVSLSNYARGKTVPRVDTLEAIASAIGCTVGDLYQS